MAESDFFYTKKPEPILAEYISCGRFVAEEVWTHKRRKLDSWEILLGLEGCVYLGEEEKKFVLEAGDLLILQAHKQHFAYKPSLPGTSFYWLHFIPINNFERADADLSTSPESPASFSIPQYMHLKDPGGFLDTFRLLTDQALQSLHQKQGCDLLCSLLLVKLAQEANFMDKPARPAWFKELLEWLRINKNQSLKVSDVARHCKKNPDYLTRVFKRYFNTSVQNYLQNLKMNEAKRLLVSGNYGLKEIARMLAYKDAVYFSKLFKKKEGLSPGKYRNLPKGLHLNRE